MNIKKIFSLVALLAVGFASAQIDRSKLPEPAQPRPIEIGNYESFELKNGLKVFVIENNKLPRVSFSLILDRDPLMEGDKAGYLGMVGQMLRRGTETRTKEQIDEEIDFIGANLSAGSTSVFASGLSKHEDKVLELMTDIIFNPTFPEEELEKIRTQTLSGLEQAKDDPNSMASNLNSAILYGADHPYGEIQTIETTNNISVDDLKAYHSAYFSPSIAYLAIVGDVETKKIKKKIKTYFGAWEAKAVAKQSYDTPEAPEKNRVNLVNRSASVQSVVNVTYPVVLPMGSPDVIPVRVMNTILGGGASSRLFMNLREDKGYTYGAYSSIGSDQLVSSFNAGASVRNEVTDSAVVEIIYEMNQIAKGEFSDDELSLAKNTIAGSFSRSLESPQTVASFALNTARHGYAEDYYSGYMQRLAAVTKEDVMRVAKKYLKPENAHINIVGKAADIAEKLERFGEVKHFDAFGTEVDPSLAQLPDGITVESVLAKYKEAVGGDEALAKFENVSMKMAADAMGRKLDIDYIMAKGGKSDMKIGMAGGMVLMKSVSDGNTATMSQGGMNAPMNAEQMEEIKFLNGLFTEFELVESGASLSLSGVEKIGDSNAYGIEVKLSQGSKFTIYFDSETGLKVRMVKIVDMPQGAQTQTVNYKNWKEVDGVMVFHEMSQQMGPMNMKFEATEVKVNQDLPEDTFSVE